MCRCATRPPSPQSSQPSAGATPLKRRSAQGFGDKLSHEEVKELMQTFGAVLYVSIPRFRDGSPEGRAKGFCFVEFATANEVSSAPSASIHTSRLPRCACLASLDGWD